MFFTAYNRANQHHPAKKVVEPKSGIKINAVATYLYTVSLTYTDLYDLDNELLVYESEK
jgi:hypothetical protein